MKRQRILSKRDLVCQHYSYVKDSFIKRELLIKYFFALYVNILKMYFLLILLHKAHNTLMYPIFYLTDTFDDINIFI